MAVLRTVLRRAAAAAAPRTLAVASSRPFSASASIAARVTNGAPFDPVPTGRDLGVGEIEGHEFKIQPLRRVGEDERTMRARLVYQSRKRGTLESDLLLSTFADAYLPQMSKEQMTQYDLFLDENDWDIYYWATQEAPSPATEASSSSSSTSTTTPGSSSDASYGGDAHAQAAVKAASSSGSTSSQTTTTSSWQPTSPFQQATDDLKAPPGQAGKNAAAAAAAASEEPYRKPGEGEWAQTVGTFKPAYRPVPARWADSEVLRLLREHVKRRSMGGQEGGGMGFMPNLKA